MEAGETGIRVDDPPAQADLVLELERFVWTAPDRLQVAGRFSGLSDVPHQPTLVVEGPHGTHRLPLVEEDRRRSPVDGVSWHVSFRWQQTPVPFERAELHLGPDVVFALGEPYADGRSALRRALRPRQRIRASRRRGVTATPQAIVARTPVAATDPSRVEATSAEPPSRANGHSGAEAIRPELDAELDATSEQLRFLHASVRRTQKELEATRAELEATRAELEATRADLEESRGHNASEAERFRAGLAAIRATADDALALEQRAAREIQLRLNEAHERIAAREADAQRLRAALEEAEDQRSSAEAEARSAVESLHSKLDDLRRNEEHSRARAETAEAAAGRSHREVETLLLLVDRIRDAVGDVR